MRRCPICSCKVKNCKCNQFAQTCKTCRTRDTLDREGNCTCCPSCGEPKTEGRCSSCTTCQLSTETEMPENPPTMSIATNSQEPPDISVLKDRSHLDYYITALKRSSGLAKAAGTQDAFHADIVLDQTGKVKDCVFPLIR